MMFNKFSLLMLCCVLLCSVSIVSAHDNSHSFNNYTLDDVNCSGVDSSSNGGQHMSVHVYQNFYFQHRVFEGEVPDAFVILYGWKEHKFITSGYTNENEVVKLNVNPLSRYHSVNFHDSDTGEFHHIDYDVRAQDNSINIAPNFQIGGL